MAEKESAFTSASFELVLRCKPFVINDSFPDFADLSGELKHDENGSIWHSHAFETVPNGTTVPLQESKHPVPRSPLPIPVVPRQAFRLCQGNRPGR